MNLELCSGKVLRTRKMFSAVFCSSYDENDQIIHNDSLCAAAVNGTTSENRSELFSQTDIEMIVDCYFVEAARP